MYNIVLAKPIEWATEEEMALHEKGLSLPVSAFEGCDVTRDERKADLITKHLKGYEMPYIINRKALDADDMTDFVQALPQGFEIAFWD